jgi:uncharacterized protein (AIM24 family)
VTAAAPVQSLADFLDETRERRRAGDAFGNVNARTLSIDVDGGAWLKPGAAIAYRGDIVFERRPSLGAGSIADAVVRETAPLVRAVGRGRLYCGYRGAHVHVVALAGERLVVAWHDLLAFQESLDFEAALVGHGVGLAAGGLVAVTLSGHGAFALATHGRPIMLEVRPGQPICTDPHATLAWSGDLAPALKTDLSWRSAIGHGGHESFQMQFDGTGFVLVQPYENPARVEVGPHPLRRVASLIAG